MKFWNSLIGGILISLAFLLIGGKLAGREDFGGSVVIPSLLLVIAGVSIPRTGCTKTWPAAEIRQSLERWATDYCQ